MTCSLTGREVKVTSSVMPTVKWFFDLAVQVVIHSLGHGGGELLGAQAVTAAYYLDVCAAALYQSVYNVLIQRLAQRTGFLGAVQHGDLLYGGGYSLYKSVGRERTVQADLQQTQLVALGVQVIDGLFDYVCAAAHYDDDVLGVRCANVIVEVILAAGELANLVHIILYDVGTASRYSLLAASRPWK